MSQNPVPENRGHETTQSWKSSPPSLRPPTLMIDLLFGALMLFAFQMGDPSNRQVIASDVNLPSIADDPGQSVQDVMGLRPIRSEDGSWLYQLSDGTVLDAEHVAGATDEASEIILIMGATDSVQNYVDAEQELRKNGLSVGMAVELKEENQR